LHGIFASLSHLGFTHVFQEHNSLADALSKDALLLDENHFVLEELSAGGLISYKERILSDL
jgi:hypothetical protein